MIVWLASYPRSGNTLLRLLLHHVHGFTTYSVYGDPLFEELGAAEVIGHAPLPAPLDELAERKEIYLVKTHGLPADDAPAIYLVRDGRDALVSYAHYILAFDSPGEDRAKTGRFRRVLDELVEGGGRYGPWGDHVLAWTRRPMGRCVPVRYEDLLTDPLVRAERALAAAGVAIPSPRVGEPPGFVALRDRWPSFFRKGRVGSWRQEMPGPLHSRFWKRHREAMEAFGYGR